jgi:hypothetical protein
VTLDNRFRKGSGTSELWDSFRYTNLFKGPSRGGRSTFKLFNNNGAGGGGRKAQRREAELKTDKLLIHLPRNVGHIALIRPMPQNRGTPTAHKLIAVMSSLLFIGNPEILEPRWQPNQFLV